MPSIPSILVPSKSQLGHRFPIFSQFFTAFEKAKVEALDHAAYFLDLARQASELTKLMGDMGAVLLEQQMQQLLQDLSEKVWGWADGKMVRNSRNGGIKFYFSSSIRLPFWISMRGGTGWNWGRRWDENGGKVQQTFWI